MDSEISYFLVTDRLRFIFGKTQFPIKAVFVVTYDQPENFSQTVPKSEKDPTIHFLTHKRDSEIIADHIVQLSQNFDEEKIFLIDQKLSLSNQDRTQLYYALLQRYKKTYFMDFDSEEEDIDGEDFVDITPADNQISLSDKMQEFNEGESCSPKIHIMEG
ncbi:MAG: hypothetical protein LBN94_01100 [Puniceicoccales bacterium]|jgi:hypothetical protein|nr:hypothetical protein [Puniceicoccales bacterium]